MVGNVLGGILLTWAVGFVGLSLFFARAWAQRREEGEYLIFALQTLTLSVYSGGLSYLTLDVGRPGWHGRYLVAAGVATAGGVLTVATGVHFAVRFARLARERLIMGPVYALSALHLLALAAGLWWKGPPQGPIELWTPFGPAVGTVPQTTWLAKSFYGLAMVGTVSLNAILARVYLGGRREALSSFLGSLVLSAAIVNDAVLAAFQRPGLFITPFGYVVFAFGVSLMLVTRYGTLSRALEARGNDLRKRTEQLRQSYEALQQAQAELVRKEQLAVVGELAAVIAHEVRNPLAIIGNAVSGLRKAKISEDDRATLLKIIDEENSRLNRLVSDLLCYARPVSPQRQLLVLRDTLERTLASPQVREEPGVKIELTCDEDTPPVWGDASLLRQVFDNLVGNAVQAMHGDGVLTVSIKPHEQDGSRGALVEIQDTGEGMDTQVRSRARTPFFTTRPSGTGLGLAIVDRIVDAHGGTMTLQSSAGEGTTVQVFLPQGRESMPPSPRRPLESGEPLSFR